jgi:ATP-dependent exoDNAse (exonuclease V) beta subunit
MYPVIILDEFQDTNDEQWRVVQALGQFCTLLALADPEQRIYDFIGADPERLNHFRVSFAPAEVDLSADNYRSPGTEIVMFGNDLLTGNFRQRTYNGIDRRGYEPYADQAMTTPGHDHLSGQNPPGEVWAQRVVASDPGSDEKIDAPCVGRVQVTTRRDDRNSPCCGHRTGGGDPRR